ncbi:MAG TPA: hypothetical protein VGB45_05705 [Abditibacterium sp.]|jgi:hypothetical protein
MAAASGQQQNTPEKAKKVVTPEQRKLYTQLGVVGFLALIAGGIYLPGMLSGDSTPESPQTPAAVTPPPGMVDPPSADGPPTGNAPSGDEVAPAPVAQVTTVSQPLARYRPDPFQQPYFIPTPTPVPPPIPPPVGIPTPFQISPVALPGNSGIAQTAQQPLNLPPVSINRLDETARRPTDAFPPRRSVGAVGGSGVPSPSTDKRLSGVIIADGVRALLEIQGPDGPITRVVQPGDEVDGITVLSIQRYNDGTKTVTRMLIRENGEERTVDLRAAPQLTTTPGG